MATMGVTKRLNNKPPLIPRLLRRRAEQILQQSYPYMDSPIFKQRRIESELFNFEVEPVLPMTTWYQPTREELNDTAITGAPQLMTAAEERLMFLRFNFSKLKLNRLQRKAKRDGLTRQLAEDLIEWHRRFEHFREYLV